jgi:hypothetical protein
MSVLLTAKAVTTSCTVTGIACGMADLLLTETRIWVSKVAKVADTSTTDKCGKHMAAEAVCGRLAIAG